ncbi:cathepsin O isoform X2 [Protopterus annectens]|uniref:cathepsin O isoform X2 n=1 Tax=Protopterus annectens TaxID=7888 RepID=UPI001CFBD0C0|nr:cathepsin O isoform X2 [Protopterus annectens]
MTINIIVVEMVFLKEICVWFLITSTVWGDSISPPTAELRNLHVQFSSSLHSNSGELPARNDSFFFFFKSYNRTYRQGSEEFHKRYKLFQESLRRHHFLSSSSNATNTATYGINQFSDLSSEEFRTIYLRALPVHVPKYSKPYKSSRKRLLPAKFDWRDKKVVTPVRNQLSCGGCWAFSIVGGIETVYALKGHPLLELSVQQVIDCSPRDYGCNGGSTVSALSWLNEIKVKLVQDSEYPFKAETGTCHHFPNSSFGVSIKGYEAHDFSAQEEEMAQKLMDSGPLAVIVDAVSWQDYQGGIIQHHCSSSEANHAVLITGFDRTGIADSVAAVFL